MVHNCLLFSILILLQITELPCNVLLLSTQFHQIVIYFNADNKSCHVFLLFSTHTLLQVTELPCVVLLFLFHHTVTFLLQRRVHNSNNDKNYDVVHLLQISVITCCYCNSYLEGIHTRIFGLWHLVQHFNIQCWLSGNSTCEPSTTKERMYSWVTYCTSLLHCPSISFSVTHSCTCCERRGLMSRRFRKFTLKLHFEGLDQFLSFVHSRENVRNDVLQNICQELQIEQRDRNHKEEKLVIEM